MTCRFSFVFCSGSRKAPGLDFSLSRVILFYVIILAFTKNPMEKRIQDMPKRNIYEKIMPEKIEVQNSMFRVSRCRWYEAIHPWVRLHPNPPDWRLYYNSAPGSYFKSSVVPPTPFAPDRFYIFPKEYSFSTWSDRPFPHFYIHFLIYDKLPSPKRHFELPADPETLRLCRQ